MTENLPKICIFTLGCKVNLYDSDAMLSIFKEEGFEVAEGLEYADIYILNTCAVTAEAEKKSRQSVARIKKINPAAQIYVCGCASQRDASQFEKDGVKYVIGTDGKLALAKDIVASVKGGMRTFGGDFSISNKFEDNDGVVNLRTRHFMKIQDGCNNFCSYCIVPYLRGRSRSREVGSVLGEFDAVKDSVKEVVVSGINLSAYGKDFGGDLASLIGELKGYDLRIRLGSLEVGVVDDRFLDATKGLKAFCPHFHLSLQSGDDEVLQAMNRRYTTAQYANAVKRIRDYYPLAGVTTDIIVGFPTESEAQFENSLSFAKEMEFADVHVFPYSSRKGTVAGKLKTLPADVMDDRVKRMTAVKKELIGNFLDKNIGVPQDVLFETCEDGMWVGHTPNYIKVYSREGARNVIKCIAPTKRYLDGLTAE